MNKKILITGGTGFIGSHLANKLSNDYEVIVYDDLSRSSQIKLNRNVKFIEGDICDIETLNQVDSDIDIIYHLAAVSRVLESIENPRKCFDINVNGTFNVVELAGKMGSKLVFSSSREVYGDAQYIPVDERHPLHPKNPYGASKLIGETIVRTMSETYGIQHTIIRLSNVYGDGDFKRVIPTYINNIKNGNDLVIYGSPTKTIDFVHVNDVVNSFVSCCNDATNNEIINVGSGHGTTLEELVNICNSMRIGDNQCHKIICSDGVDSEVNNFVANITKAKQLLNHRNSVSLKSGISELI